MHWKQIISRISRRHQAIAQGLQERLPAIGLRVAPSLPILKRLVNCSMRSILSMISVNRRAGSLEGTHGLAVHVLSHARLEGPFLDQIDRPAEQVGELVFDPDHVQQ